jgi:hypothetical protein
LEVGGEGSGGGTLEEEVGGGTSKFTCAEGKKGDELDSKRKKKREKGRGGKKNAAAGRMLKMGRMEGRTGGELRLKRAGRKRYMFCVVCSRVSC